MHILNIGEYPRVAVRIDGVVKVKHKHSDYLCLNALATLQFSNSSVEPERQIALWAPLECFGVLQVETAFSDREVSLDAIVPVDYDKNPYSRISIGVSDIWFDDPTEPRIGCRHAQVRHTIRSENDPVLLYFTQGPPESPGPVVDMT